MYYVYIHICRCLKSFIVEQSGTPTLKTKSTHQHTYKHAHIHTYKLGKNVLQAKRLLFVVYIWVNCSKDIHKSYPETAFGRVC